MANASVSDVQVEFCGVKFTLRASLAAMVPLERKMGESYAAVMSRALNASVPRLSDVSEMFAAFALPHGKHTAEGVVALIGFAEQGQKLKELRDHVAATIDAALPKDQKPAEDGGNAPADPQ